MNEPERSWKALVGSERPPGSPRIDAGVVERLRTFAEATNEAWEPGSLHRDAADEIERLGEELADAQQDNFHLRKYLASTEVALSCIVASGAYPEAAIAQEALEATEVTQ